MLRGAGDTFFIADFGFLGLKLAPASAGEKKKIQKNFEKFFSQKKNNVASLKSSKSGIWVGGSKAISEGVGVILNARGGHKFFF